MQVAFRLHSRRMYTRLEVLDRGKWYEWKQTFGRAGCHIYVKKSKAITLLYLTVTTQMFGLGIGVKSSL
jgi:hypothetical protein